MTACLPSWSERVVSERLVAERGHADPEVVQQAREAGEDAAGTIGPELRALLAADVDEQGANPLTIVRRAVRWPTAVLRHHGVRPVQRDGYDQTHFPDDVYGLTPANFADLDPALGELGILWGAVKARAHLVRHRRP